MTDETMPSERALEAVPLPDALAAIERLWDRGGVTLLDVKIALAELASEAPELPD